MVGLPTAPKVRVATTATLRTVDVSKISPATEALSFIAASKPTRVQSIVNGKRCSITAGMTCTSEIGSIAKARCFTISGNGVNRRSKTVRIGSAAADWSTN
uniref:Uncharacterized protein n=1 Tax=Proboscia inermis TaxID=420281 RepID=A0A7S0CEX7_9STRA